MPLPDGVSTFTLTADFPPLSPDGSERAGTFTFTPVPDVLVSSTGVYLGVENATLSASGTLSKELVANDALDEPFIWRVDVNVTGMPPFSQNISVPASAGTVALGTLLETDVLPDNYVVVVGPRGPQGEPGSSVAGALLAVNNLNDVASASTARSNLGLGGAAVLNVGTSLGTVAAGNDSRLSDARTPTAHAATHEQGGTDELTLTQAQITGLVSALAALLPKAGGTLTGDLTLDGHNLTVQRADDTGAFRFRVTGGGLDLEIAGLDVFVSAWANPDFSGTQSNVMRWEPAGPHLIGRTQFGTGPFDDVHDIDAGTGVAALGAKNGLVNIRFCGRRSSSGAPTAGTWATGDTVLDSAGVVWLCTAGGTPGTWSGGATADPWVFDVTSSAYGAVGDGQVVTDGAMASGSTTLTSATAAFTAGDQGKAILVKGAGASGVTTLVTTISTVDSSTSVTLAAANASGGSVSGALVMWATDDTDAIQAAIDAAGAYATAHGAATVRIPAPSGRFYGIAGPLVTGGSTLGNAQLTLPVVASAGNKAILTFEGPADAAAVQHWEQTVPQLSGATLVSFGVFASSAAQIASINANGNTCVLGGPSQPGGYGVAPGVFSNMHVTLRNLSILTTHSANGLTYGAVDLSGVANAAIENFAYGTAGTVAGGDYGSPGGFANGLCPGLLLPASGNNDLVLLRNVTCHGGYTYGVFATEHADIVGMRILYCWAAFCPVGTYYSSVGSTHAIVATLLSIEACTYLVYIIGAGSGGIGPFLHLRIDTETSTPRFGDNNSGFASSCARGDVVLTGLYTRSGLTLDHPVGYDILDGQLSYPAVAVTGTYTASTFDESVQADAASGAFTVTLPTAAGRCRRLLVTKTDASGNAVTVAAAGSETVNGAASTSLAAQWDSVELLPLASGSGWIAR